MLTSLSLENFKAFHKLDNLAIKPITILCGTNSCGKSSILQSILMMKQSFENIKYENGEPIFTLILAGKYVKFGEHIDIYYKKNNKNSPKSAFEIHLGDDSYFNLFFSLGNENYIEYYFSAPQKKLKSLDFYRKKYQNIIDKPFGNFSYLGGLRKGFQPGGTYFGDSITEIGNLGENAPFLYDREKENIIENSYLVNPQTDTFYKPEQALSIEQALDFWFSYMGIKGFKNEEFKRTIYLSVNASPYDQTEIDLSQVGFGVSQMFPILLEGLRMPVGGTLLLEQPEIHLHPNLQMQMADFLLSLAHSGKGVIAETHSDHIVNRLVRRIVEDETGTLKDMIAIYFIRPSDDGAICEPVEIDDTRGIVNWPKDFFDQAANEQMRIMQAGLKKRRNLKNNPK